MVSIYGKIKKVTIMMFIIASMLLILIYNSVIISITHFIIYSIKSLYMVSLLNYFWSIYLATFTLGIVIFISSTWINRR